ncbi:MAG TPA: DUF2207 domain-containing protein [Candidatus Paceibacterota bacterium]|nr:DUF2207 domain-containing protein [Candidatus Paceibacterota bacterium]
MATLYTEQSKNVTKKWLLTVVLFIAFLVGNSFIVARVNAQESSFTEESILNFISSIKVNIDDSVDVFETITYNTGSQERHGIYRDIYPYSSTDQKMAITDVSVTDLNNVPYTFVLSNSGSNFRIKIGDANETFSGQKTYLIKYHASRAVAQFKDFDEIYWNVTGNEWTMPIYQASASIVLPSGVSIIQSACYYGPKGNKDQCQMSNDESGSYDFSAPSLLGVGEGLTAAVGFTKGVVIPYSASDKVSNFFDTYWPWLVSAILPILTLILSLLYWYRKGRDARGTGVIVPQYDVPDALTPMEVGGIANEKVNAKNISAEIIYLATKGYLKIRQLDERFIGLIKSTDYELTKLKDFSDLPNDFDQKLLNGLFNAEPMPKLSDLKNLFFKSASPIVNPEPNLSKQSVKLSDLKYVFYKYSASVITSVLDALLNKGYYKNLGRMKNTGSRIALILFMSVWASGFFGGILGVFLLRGNPFPLIVGIFVSIIIYGIISHFSPAKTENGVATLEYILGLKDYLQIAEKDRLLFHNAPEKNPEVFEKLLPYAMVLDVANIWAKEFEGIYTTPPSWYSGSSSTAFSAIMFTNSLSNFSSFTSSSLGSSPSGSGSGGGGSSGGGGGGGGGGGW